MRLPVIQLQGARPERDIVEDALGKAIGFLEDHAYASAQIRHIDREGQDILAVELAPRDRIVKILKWVGAVTSILSLIFGLYQLTNLMAGVRDRQRKIAESLDLGSSQRTAGDFARACALLGPGLAPPDPLATWRAAFAPLGDTVGPGFLRRLAAQFRLDPDEIAALATLAATDLPGLPPEATQARLWHLAGRAHVAPELPGCRLQDPVHDWNDLVLPAGLAQSLHQV